MISTSAQRSARLRPGRLAGGLLAFACALLLAPATSAELAKWDQARVTALAQELAEKADGVSDALRKGPQSNIGSGQSSSFYRFKQQVRRLKSETRFLANELAAGKGFDETLGIFEDIESQREAAAREARRLFMPEQTLAAITSAGDVMRRLRPYYLEPEKQDP